MNFNIKITPTALNTLKKLKNNIGNNKDYKAVARAICHPSTTWKSGYWENAFKEET